MTLKIEFAKVIGWQRTDIQTADILKPLGRRYLRSELQRQSILPLIDVRKHAAVVDQCQEFAAAPRSQSCHNKVKTEDHHLVDAIATLSIYSESELIARRLNIDTKLTRHFVEKARIFSK